ncbi:hypothetical protein AALP_AA4G269000 [Arabis alpina]|uniref:HMA domain-containing protein n=1 Tax=Arabis alpina TaxID=50452 RepID=A0A087H5X8_ARAAL|nr:hypothetical protein AALP_AA4G269000 [Arabis alpina]
MMTTKTVPDHTLNLKTLVLKVFIHCQGCQKKVLKILGEVEGVHSAVVDAQHNNKVTVTGHVDAVTLIKRLARSGKYAELISSEELLEKKKEKSNKKSIVKYDGVRKQGKKEKHSGGEASECSGDGGSDKVGEMTVVVSTLPPLDPIAYHHALPVGSYGTEPYVVGGAMDPIRFNANEYEEEPSGCFIM